MDIGLAQRLTAPICIFSCTAGSLIRSTPVTETVCKLCWPCCALDFLEVANALGSPGHPNSGSCSKAISLVVKQTKHCHRPQRFCQVQLCHCFFCTTCSFTLGLVPVLALSRPNFCVCDENHSAHCVCRHSLSRHRHCAPSAAPRAPRSTARTVFSILPVPQRALCLIPQASTQVVPAGTSSV